MEQIVGPLTGYVPCIKRTVYCKIVRMDGPIVYVTEAINLCKVEGHTECPRKDDPTETHYEKCGPPIHAEVLASVLSLAHLPIKGEAYIWGHDHVCDDCKHALALANVEIVSIVENLPASMPQDMYLFPLRATTMHRPIGEKP